MDPVSMLIFNALAQRRGVNLPGIGSLCVVTEAARMQENGKLIPPINRVRYVSEQAPGYDDILRLIGDSSGRDESGSREIYEAWLSEVCAPDGVHMASIGEIVEGKFKPAEELLYTLNPSGVAVVQLPRSFTLRQIFFWIGTTVVVGGGLAAGLITYLNSRPSPYDAPYAEGTPGTESIVSTDTLRSGVGETERALDALTERDLTLESETGNPIAEKENPTSAGGTVTSSEASKTVDNRSASGGGNAEERAPGTIAETPQPGSMRYYVVVGTYSTEENAERFIASARQKDPSQTYRKLLLSNGKIMVYTADVASDAEAQQQRRSLNATFPDAWVFKRRAR